MPTSNEPLLLLHLSDLHFGNTSRFASKDPKELGKTCAADIQLACKRLRIRPAVGLVLVSGDIAELAKYHDYRNAKIFLRSLSETLSVQREKFVFCPGNHDVSWTRCKMIELEQEEEDFSEEEFRCRMDGVKFKFYQEFLQSWYGKHIDTMASQLGNGAWLHRFPDLRLSVAALNSCERESHRWVDHRGEIGEDQLKTLIKIWQQEDAKHWLKIVMFHHHPDPMVEDNIDDIRTRLCDALEGQDAEPTEIVDRYVTDLIGLEGRDRVKNLVENTRAQLVLHGHQHAGDLGSWLYERGSALVVSAGSAFVSDKEKPMDQPNAMRLILLDTERAIIRGWALVYDPRNLPKDRVSTGAFVLGNGQGDEIKEQALYLPEGFIGSMEIEAEIKKNYNKMIIILNAAVGSLKYDKEGNFVQVQGSDILDLAMAKKLDLKGVRHDNGTLVLEIEGKSVHVTSDAVTSAMIANQIETKVWDSLRLKMPTELVTKYTQIYIFTQAISKLLNQHEARRPLGVYSDSMSFFKEYEKLFRS